MNKKLTKAQRHIAYIIMREEIKDSEFFCIAAKVIGIFEEDPWPIYDDEFKEQMPELHRKKPLKNYSGSCWFSGSKSGIEKRIELLNQCIIETYEY